MQHNVEDIEYAEYLFDCFYSIGAVEDGGVSRLGYTETEDEMHSTFARLGEEKGYKSYVDEVGNTYLYDGAFQKDDEYYLIGSHLDSVIDGGRYDGVSGIITGFLILEWLRRDGIKVPVRIGAMRCEESSNFGRSTIGSGLITNESYKHDIGDAVSRSGEELREIFAKKGYSLQPRRIQGIKEYIELHIEQGKVLEEYGDQVGIVSTIAGPRRFKIHIHGVAEHSGATPMRMRSDALCAASEIILEVEEIGESESFYQSVATVGVIENKPNAMNVVPGEVTLGVDIRGIDIGSLDRMEARLKAICKKVCEKRKLKYFREKISDIPPISMSVDMQQKLMSAAKRLKMQHRLMVSGAGHDAMSFANICDSALVFIPCAKGISHNKNEFATIESICDGAKVIYEYLKEEARE
ncbi:MAG: hydantoinase/carbamoylase family amidase [Clostridiales bacterium]|nr:hydantoinase/carbamoylase family amidase [Clostridiales bacterium]